MNVKAIIPILILNGICVNIFAQIVPPIIKADRSLLRKYKSLVEKEWFGDERSQFNPATIDDELIFKSADKKFKLFIFRGETCGGTCNVFYDAFVHVNAVKPKAYHIRLYPVTHIYKLEDSKYLILQKGYHGGGNLQEDCLQATLISLKDNKMAEHAIKYPLDSISIEKSFLITQNIGVVEDEELREKNFILKYDPVLKRLNYAYLKPKENWDKVFSCKGNFSYINGEFIFGGETKVELP